MMNVSHVFKKNLHISAASLAICAVAEHQFFPQQNPMINPLSNLPQIYNYYVSTIIRFMFTDPLPTYNDLHFSRLKKCDELGMCLQLETLTWKNKKKMHWYQPGEKKSGVILA